MFTFLIIILIIGGLLLYSLLGIEIIDEAAVALLVSYAFLVRLQTHRPFPKEFVVYMWIMLCYTIYSICLNITSPIAILYDLQQQVKPFLCFYSTIYLMPVFSKRQIKFILFACKISFIVALLFLPQVFVNGSFMGGHVTNLATLAMTIFCVSYFFKKKREKKMIAYLSLGLFSGRSKFFVTYAFSIFLLFFHRKFKLLNIKTMIISGLILSFLVYFVIWDKFNLYFVQGFEEQNGVARSMFYIKSVDIFKDYFPFGSGLATFANNASGVFYSPLYYNYDLWTIWGLTADNPMFVGDTFYPELAQFGVCGVVLFIWFFYRRYNEICKLNNDSYVLGIIILITLLFESFADTTILSNRGVLYFMILGFLHNEGKRQTLVKSR